ncbi:MAG: hypothetical protein ACFFAL_06695 [Promethearchaeota archaeon]
MISINVWKPRIGQTSISCKKQLHEIISQEYPGIKRNANFSKLASEAEIHLALFIKLRERDQLRKDGLASLIDEIGARHRLVHRFVRLGVRPRLYYMIEKAISKSKASILLRKIFAKNCNIYSSNDVKNRISNYYFAKEIINSSHFKFRIIQCDKYFRALELLEDGGFISDIANEVNTHHERVRQWVANQERPSLVNLANRVPDVNPELGNKWLPLKIAPGRGFHPTNFIQAPIRVNTWEQIELVLGQINTKKKKDSQQDVQYLGDFNKEQAFAYLLGICVSDAQKPRKSLISTGLNLRLSKKHKWSKQVGEATCLFLSKIGIRARLLAEKQDHLEHKSFYWYSQRSPLITWMLQSCLGLGIHEQTSSNLIDANWLLTAPYKIRLKFLQGITDGDGCATIKGQRIDISSYINSQFFRELLKTFEIEASSTDKKTIIRKQESIIRAVELPFFLFAEIRQKNANKLALMIQARRKQKRRSVPYQVANQMKILRDQGESFGKIAEIIFDHHGLSYTVDKVIKTIKKMRIAST